MAAILGGVVPDRQRTDVEAGLAALNAVASAGTRGALLDIRASRSSVPPRAIVQVKNSRYFGAEAGANAEVSSHVTSSTGS